MFTKSAVDRIFVLLSLRLPDAAIRERWKGARTVKILARAVRHSPARWRERVHISLFLCGFEKKGVLTFRMHFQLGVDSALTHIGDAESLLLFTETFQHPIVFFHAFARIVLEKDFLAVLLQRRVLHESLARIRRFVLPVVHDIRFSLVKVLVAAGYFCAMLLLGSLSSRFVLLSFGGDGCREVPRGAD